MKFLVVSSFLIALASATPFTRFIQPGLMKSSLNPMDAEFGIFGMNKVMTGNTEQVAHDMTEQAQQDMVANNIQNMEQTIQNMNTVNGMPMPGKTMAVAQRIASELTDQAVQAENVQLQESMQQIQMDRGMMMNGKVMNPGMIKQQAINEMQKDMWVGQTTIMTSTKEMEQTLEAALQAQMAMQGTRAMSSPVAMTMAKKIAFDFQIHVQKLIEENNMEKTHMAICKNQYELKQLQNQVQFLNYQMQQLRTQEMMMPNQQTSQFAQAEEKLTFQLMKLMGQEMALQMVIEQLQQVMMSQQKEIMYTQADQATMTNPMMMMMMKTPMMMNMPMMMKTSKMMRD